MRDDAPQRIADAVRASTGSWTHLFRPAAIDGIALCVATAAPMLAEPGQVTLAKLGAWICAFDDAIDGGELAGDDLVHRVACYEQLVRTGACPELAFDPIARVLAEALDELAAAPLGPALRPLLADQLVASCAAMRWERTAPADTPLGVYLHHAADSICVGFVITAAAMLIGERVPLPALLAAERHAAMAVRIANDVATWPREQAEGVANALRFGSPDRIAARAASAHHDLALALDRLAGAPALAAFVRAFAGWFLALYRHGDLDDVARVVACATSR